MGTIEENKAWVAEFWKTHDVMNTTEDEFISWVREKQRAVDAELLTKVLQEETLKNVGMFVVHRMDECEHEETVVRLTVNADFATNVIKRMCELEEE